MKSLNAMNTQGKNNYTHLKRHNAIESGRINALSMLVNGEPLEIVLREIIASLESATSGLKCSINLMDKTGFALSPFVSPSLPTLLLDALQNQRVIPPSTTCAFAIANRELTVTEDITQDPHWLKIRDTALACGIRACWSQPIISPSSEVLGTFSMYLSTCGAPEQDDIDSLIYESQIVSIILERANNIQQLEETNAELERRVEARTEELTNANKMLKKALEQRNEVQNQLVELENMAALGTMMSSLTHEINTPTGVAITATSYLQSILSTTTQSFKEGQLKRSQLTSFFNKTKESVDIIERNLVRSTQLIKTFKQLSLDQHSQEVRKINLMSYVNEILLTLKPRLKRSNQQFCFDIDPDLEVYSNPGALSQLLINLIMNSVQHAFELHQIGHIFFKIRIDEKIADHPLLKIIYKDNGRGMSEHTLENLYKPFFTSARQNGGSGLGMHICYDIVVKVLAGHIECKSKIGKGVEFTVVFPVALDEPELDSF
ncbi:GAF domain-containing sensor histidine kinase [Aliiglaciecola sp. 3_MG-2023]|uniref:GAF domain-containing sensor histidine kinase n=1 Tax=Aliiglaciecola sp. 3_MG-2023 TaxID=3062644 RepID=UPI0026E429FA|nr:GAF domain-containing sensor histidine kinase [Aliiglaciecola sp. 3_MG-2023]MDO6692772.1 GAF domain-containing sensor histidine kinase [Aliiglaciecola sp. 3_MG-2023]